MDVFSPDATFTHETIDISHCSDLSLRFIFSSILVLVQYWRTVKLSVHCFLDYRVRIGLCVRLCLWFFSFTHTHTHTNTHTHTHTHTRTQFTDIKQNRILGSNNLCEIHKLQETRYTVDCKNHRPRELFLHRFTGKHVTQRHTQNHYSPASLKFLLTYWISHFL